MSQNGKIEHKKHKQNVALWERGSKKQAKNMSQMEKMSQTW
jgi:hypothetical protein